MTDNDNAGTFGFMFSLHFELRFHAFCEPNPEYARLAYLKTTKTSFFYTQLFGLAYFAGVFSFNGNFFKIRQRPKYARKRPIRQKYAKGNRALVSLSTGVPSKIS